MTSDVPRSCSRGFSRAAFLTGEALRARRRGVGEAELEADDERPELEPDRDPEGVRERGAWRRRPWLRLCLRGLAFRFSPVRGGLFIIFGFFLFSF